MFFSASSDNFAYLGHIFTNFTNTSVYQGLIYLLFAKFWNAIDRFCIHFIYTVGMIRTRWVSNMAVTPPEVTMVTRGAQ